MSSSERLRDGQIFGRYQIVRMVGEGGMGSVYEAIHTGLKKRFAIKTLLPSIAESPEAKARFLREGEAASRINHPNVVDVSDVGTEDGVPYLVMEYFEGETLGDFITRKGALDVALALDLFLPVLSAVSAGHDQGVIHRDLKPQNIFLARGAWGERVPKILDFGVSKLIGGDNPALTGTLSVLGTASYMSPEQARGAKVVDASSDQYALGLILYEMLTGARAYIGDSPLEVLHKIATGSIVSPRAARSDIPVEVDTVVMKMLAMRPADRHVSLRAVGRALLPLAGDRSRSMYQGGFDESESVGRPTGAMPVATVRGGGTMVLGAGSEAQGPGDTLGVGVDGTRLLPRPAVDTTLGQGASETQSRTATPRRTPRLVAFGLAIAALAAVAVVSVRSGGSRRIAAVEPPPPAAVAAPATAAAELPGPPPAAAAPVPPPAPAPSPLQAPSAVREVEESARHGHSSSNAREHATHGGGHHPKTPPTPAGAPAAPASPTNRRGANNAPILE